MTHNGPLAELSFKFAIDIVHTYKTLAESRREYVMSKQLLRSGTGVGALIREARNAESKRDFVHKLGIAQKECDETLYWLELLFATGYLGRETFVQMSGRNQEILWLIKSIILTTRQRYDLK